MRNRRILASDIDYFRFRRPPECRARGGTRQGTERAAEPKAAGPPTLQAVVDHERLLKTLNRLALEGGPAPGPDGVTYRMLGRRERAAAMRDLSKEILDGRYRPSRARHVRLPKSGGRGYRTLRLRSILDRVVAARLAEVLGRFWERRFLPGSHGFRPGRGVWTALVHLERIIEAEGRFVLAQDDIANAFDNVPIDLVVDLHPQHVEDGQLVDLLERMLRGASDQGGAIGIDQGSPISPLLLNVLLHHVLDIPFGERAANPPWLRYADDLAYLTGSVPEGREAIARARGLLEQHGMTLKGEGGPPADIRRRKAHALGVTVRWEHRLRLAVPTAAWKRLGEKLLEAHRTENPPDTAQRVAEGWALARGAAFESGRNAAIRRILSTAAQQGFREISRDRLEQLAQSGWDRWEARRECADLGDLFEEEVEVDAAAPPAADRLGRP